MNKAKIRLSKKEERLVQNADVILTKNQILLKTKLMLEQVQQNFIDYLKHYRNSLPHEVSDSVPKISKGENYLGLPYLILDYPRCFKKHNIFAVRTMFWWGNFFSITLHLSGKYKVQHEAGIISSYQLLKKENYFISIYENEWEHHFEKTNYVRIGTLSKASFEKRVSRNSFLKIAYKIPLTQWDEAAEKFFEHFKKLIGISNQLPSR